MTEDELDDELHGPAQDFVRRERALRRRWQKLCEDAVQLARDKGAADPNIYVEAEAGFCVVNRETHVGGPDAKRDPDAETLVHLWWPKGVKADCGAW